MDTGWTDHGCSKQTLMQIAGGSESEGAEIALFLLLCIVFSAK